MISLCYNQQIECASRAITTVTNDYCGVVVVMMLLTGKKDFVVDYHIYAQAVMEATRNVVRFCVEHDDT